LEKTRATHSRDTKRTKKPPKNPHQNKKKKNKTKKKKKQKPKTKKKTPRKKVGLTIGSGCLVKWKKKGERKEAHSREGRKLT